MPSLKETYPLYLNNKAQQPNTDLEVTDKFTGKAVRVKGKVDKVCQAKGCWMALKGPSGKHSARITFKDYAFFVPKDIMGRTASVEGTVELKKLSKAMREHLAKDEGTDIANVPEVELRMVATGVEIM